MDPQRQKQMVNAMMFANSAKTDEELNQLSAEEKREYLRGRLKQRMFINGASRQSSYQKKQMQDKMQKKIEEEQVKIEELAKKKAEKNRKKRERKKLKKQQKIEEVVRENEEVVVVERESESDYESDED